MIVLRLYWLEHAFWRDRYGYINIEGEVKKQNIRISQHGELSITVKKGHGFHKVGCGRQSLQWFPWDPSHCIHVLVRSSLLECGWDLRLASTQYYRANVIGCTYWLTVHDYFAWVSIILLEDSIFLASSWVSSCHAVYHLWKGPQPRCWRQLPVNS